MGFLAITLEFIQDCAGTLVQFTFQLKTLRNSSPIVGSVATLIFYLGSQLFTPRAYHVVGF